MVTGDPMPDRHANAEAEFFWKTPTLIHAVAQTKLCQVGGLEHGFYFSIDWE